MSICHWRCFHRQAGIEVDEADRNIQQTRNMHGRLAILHPPTFPNGYTAYMLYVLQAQALLGPAQAIGSQCLYTTLQDEFILHVCLKFSKHL